LQAGLSSSPLPALDVPAAVSLPVLPSAAVKIPPGLLKHIDQAPPGQLARSDDTTGQHHSHSESSAHQADSAKSKGDEDSGDGTEESTAGLRVSVPKEQTAVSVSVLTVVFVTNPREAHTRAPDSAIVQDLNESTSSTPTTTADESPVSFESSGSAGAESSQPQPAASSPASVLSPAGSQAPAVLAPIPVSAVGAPGATSFAAFAALPGSLLQVVGPSNPVATPAGGTLPGPAGQTLGNVGRESDQGPRIITGNSGGGNSESELPPPQGDKADQGELPWPTLNPGGADPMLDFLPGRIDRSGEQQDATITDEVFAQAGLPWWPVLLLTAGSLAAGSLAVRQRTHRTEEDFPAEREESSR
jgi:hypothetical protein